MYVSDGYGNHHRVVVFDAEPVPTSAIGAPMANRRSTCLAIVARSIADARGSEMFRDCALCRDCQRRLVYVCDRTRNRIQVFRKDGTFLEEVSTVKVSISSGSAWDVAFSPDPQQSSCT